VRILRLRRRQARDANPEVLNLEIGLTLGEVVLAVKRTDRRGNVIVHGREIRVVDGARRALYLTGEGGTCTYTCEGGCARRNSEQLLETHREPPLWGLASRKVTRPGSVTNAIPTTDRAAARACCRITGKAEARECHCSW
jgi:hypothetical protein